jgi:hypothetical protein
LFKIKAIFYYARKASLIGIKGKGGKKFNRGIATLRELLTTHLFVGALNPRGERRVKKFYACFK